MALTGVSKESYVRLMPPVWPVKPVVMRKWIAQGALPFIRDTKPIGWALPARMQVNMVLGGWKDAPREVDYVAACRVSLSRACKYKSVDRCNPTIYYLECLRRKTIERAQLEFANVDYSLLAGLVHKYFMSDFIVDDNLEAIKELWGFIFPAVDDVINYGTPRIIEFVTNTPFFAAKKNI